MMLGCVPAIIAVSFPSIPHPATKCQLMKRLLALMICMTMAVSAHSDEPKNALNFQVVSIDGDKTNLEDYRGKVVLVVNVASACGLTPQYTGLQELYEKYKDQGFVVLGFPSNQFGAQEPGTDSEIKTFCSTKYNVSFPMFSKVDVNGANAVPLYKHLTSQDAPPVGSGKISWNFEKFLIGRDGKLVNRFSPRTKPTDGEVIKAVEAQLASG
jgi:glutathione peroxidase